MAREAVVRKIVTPREVKGEPSTPRSRIVRERYLKAEPRVDPERAYLYTKSWKETEGEPVEIRRGKSFKYVMSNLTPVIREGELIVGNTTRYVRGSSPYPEFSVKWMKNVLKQVLDEDEKYVDVGTYTKEANFGVYKISTEDLNMLKECIEYWDGRSLDCLARKYIGMTDWKDEFEAGESAQWFTRLGSEIPEGRLVLDYGKVLKLGFRGIIDEAKNWMKLLEVVTMDDFRKLAFYQGVINALEGVIQFAKNYANEARRLSKEEKNRDREKELLEIAERCEWVSENPPRGFKDALQLYWFTVLSGQIESFSFGFSPGRFDQYMYPFYRKDIDEGKITNKEVLELLELLRVKFTEIQRVCSRFWEGHGSGNLYQNMMLGGMKADGEDASNELSILVLQAAINQQTTQPTLSVRWNDKLNEEFLLKAIELVKTGVGMPAWFNDEVAIQHFLGYTGCTLEEARDYAMGGCTEMTLPGKRYGIVTPGFVNQAKCLELALNNGVNPIDGKQLGPKTGKINSFEDLHRAFLIQMQRAIELMCKGHAILMGVHRELVPLIFHSAVMDDCLEKGLSMDNGGIRYKDSPTILSVGMINVANSMAAIKKCVFEDKTFTLNELKKALISNFKGDGYASVHRKLLDAPKFGNDDDYVDLIAKELYEEFAEEVYKYKNYFGVPYTPGALSISSHPHFGRVCGASPDGRLAGVSLCDGAVSAFPGTDKNGPTSLVKSATKVDSIPHMVVLFNMKFHPTALKGIEGSKKLLSLIKTYFDRGGWHVQFNVVDTKMLRDAQRNPEKYRDLIVRVAGFSAYWVELSKAVQDEVIARTEYETC
jgi:formate C-acetyltransferase/4-hydroxyphenylacetate decarboxylase large subunit